MSFTNTFPVNIIKLALAAIPPVQIERADSAVGGESVTTRIFILSDSASGIEITNITRFESDQGAGVEQIVSLSAYLPASDIGYSGELAQKTYAETLVIDQSEGIEEIAGRYIEIADSAGGTELAKIYLISIDGASAAEIVIEKIFASFDQSSATDRLTQKEMGSIADYSNGSEGALISFNMIDIATTSEAIIFERIIADISGGSEKRLSPIPVKSADVATTIDITVRSVRSRSDGATGIEASWISILALDKGIATDIVAILSKATKDSSAGTEKRLSPIPLAGFDTSSGYEHSQFGYREWIRIDNATGTGKVAEKYIDKVIDGSIGADISEINKYVGDRSSGIDISFTMSRLIIDRATGIENRLSPIPLLRSDGVTGYDRAWFYWWEGKSSDSAIAREGLTGKQMILPETASAIEKALIGLAGSDSAAGVDIYTSKGINVLDAAIASENRLSPIPVKVSDIAQAIEDIVYRTFTRPDAGIGNEAPIIEAYLAPMLQPLNSESSISTHEGYVNGSMNEEAKASIGAGSRGLTVFASASDNSLGSSFSTSGRSSAFADMTLANAINPDESISTEKTGVPSEVAVQSINTDNSINIEGGVYAEASDVNRINSNLVEQERAETVNSGIVNETTMQSIGHAIYRTYTPQALLDESGKLRSAENTDVSMEQTFKPIESDGKLFVSSNPISGNRSDQFLSEIAEQMISLGSKITSGDMQNFVSESIDLVINLGKEQEAGEMHGQSITIDDKIALNQLRNVMEQSYIEIKSLLPIIASYTSAERYTFNSQEFTENAIYGLTLFYRFVTASFLYLAKLQELEKSLRYVKEGDEVQHTDHNIFVDAFQLFLEFAEQITIDRFRNDPDVNGALDALKSAISNLQKVKAFDVINPEYHNQVIECLLTGREFVKIIRQKVGLKA